MAGARGVTPPQATRWEWVLDPDAADLAPALEVSNHDAGRTGTPGEGEAKEPELGVGLPRRTPTWSVALRRAGSGHSSGARSHGHQPLFRWPFVAAIVRPLVGRAGRPNTRRVSNVIGRDAELATGWAFLERSRRGLAVMLLEGEAGIGKTTVWAALVDRARAEGRLVLTARSAAPEAQLTLSALADLLDPVAPDAFDALPEPQRRALEAALLRTEPRRDALEPRLLGTAVRSLLDGLARSRPVILAVDDVQWVDATSATVLAFALRRLGDSRVGFLATRRAPEALPIDLPSIAGAEMTSTVTVGPLTVAALHHVLRRRLGRPVSRSTLIRVHQASGGVPLFALEIVRLLDEVGVPPVGEPLPVPADVRDLVRRQVVRLPPRTREVLLASAILGQSAPQLIEAALGRPIGRDLSIAARQGVARIESGRIAFVHPLFAAAIPAEATPAERREVHGRLARVVTGTEARARHRALASAGPSEDVAAELEAAAREANSRGGPGAATELMELALQMTPPSDDAGRNRRIAELAGFLQRAGDPGRAQDLLVRVIEIAESAHLRARARLDLAAIRYESDAAGSALALCEAAIPDAGGDTELLARAHAMIAVVSWDDFRRREGNVREALRLLEGLVDPDPVVLGLVLMERCENDVAAGRPLDPAIVERALDLERRAAPASVSDRFSASLGTWLKYTDDFDGARLWLERTQRAAVEEGDDGSLPYAMSHLPELELWTGHWQAGEDIARRHFALAAELGLESQRRQALYNLALLHVHQGREEEARAEMEEALTAAAADDDIWTTTSIVPLLGHLELSLGNAAAAAGHLLRATELRDRVGHPAPRRQDADLVESLVAIGDLDRARQAWRRWRRGPSATAAARRWPTRRAPERWWPPPRVTSRGPSRRWRWPPPSTTWRRSRSTARARCSSSARFAGAGASAAPRRRPWRRRSRSSRPSARAAGRSALGASSNASACGDPRARD